MTSSLFSPEEQTDGHTTPKLGHDEEKLFVWKGQNTQHERGFGSEE
jgi:hypothetical protein